MTTRTFGISLGLAIFSTACGLWPELTLPYEDGRSTVISDPTSEPTEPTDEPTEPAVVPPLANGFEARERVMRDEVFWMSVALNADTVLCSAADYSSTFLKVLIPGLAGVTLFDHRNASAGAPCIAAGICSDDLGVESILGSGEGFDNIEVRVILTGLYDIDHDAQTCTVSLKEELFTRIRDVEFMHRRDGFISTRNYSDCLGI